jgi:MFS superfamily sulfate permease-like transporter
MNRDLLALGFGNLVAASLGGLPMISEVVRSYANVTYGARTRWANFFHGACLLAYTALLASAIHYIPVAALAGILCVTGYRLAAPKHFKECRNIGLEQLIVFTATIVCVLLTDLLVGVVIGVVVQLVCGLIMGAPVRSAFSRISAQREKEEDCLTIKMPAGCAFTQVIGLKRLLYATSPKSVCLDFTETVFVDHTFAREVQVFKADAETQGISVSTPGIDRLRPVSDHPEAARRLANQQSRD